MSRRKRQPEPFDVVEFLRESDGDLKSALNSLLRSPAPTADEDSSLPGPKLVPSPAPVLNGNEHSDDAALSSGPDPKATAALNAIPALNATPHPDLTAASNLEVPPNLAPDPNLIPAPVTAPPTGLIPAPNLISGSELQESPEPAPAPTSPAPKKRQFPIREMTLAEHAHTRAEQQVYEYLWQNARPLDEISRTITIGFGAMARIVRLSESNARINVRSLIAKLAIEEFGDYNCERSLGRTYRIFNYSEILKRRREANLLWYMRRTLAVVFVDPRTGQPIDLGLRKPRPPKPGSGPKLNRGIQNAGETSSSADLRVFEALSQYGVAGEDVIRRLRAQTRNVCPDFTDEELVHFIHLKGQLIGSRDSGISSPIGFLLTSVPKCFVGQSFEQFRKAQREALEREAAGRAQREAEFENWRREQQAILDDPNAPEEDKTWARKVLSPDQTS